jgi:ABC-type multidrug transport system ATPase subunit
MHHPTRDPQFAIEATGLQKTFGEILAVHDVDLLVRTVLYTACPNGAGKTTAIQMLATSATSWPAVNSGGARDCALSHRRERGPRGCPHAPQPGRSAS